MSKQTVYVLINCNRVFEGTVRNVLPPIASVTTASVHDIKECLWFGEQESSTIAAAAGGSGDSDIDAARKAVEAALAAPQTMPQSASATKKSAGSEKKGCKIPIEPDCILFSPSDYEDANIAAVKLMRRKCRFRDVPIVIVSQYSDVPRAKALVAAGADEILIVPIEPDKLQKRLNNLLLPVGVRVPVITKIVNPYIAATVDLLSTMAGLHAERKEVFLKKNYRLFGDVSAIMALSGKVEGEVTVCFEEHLARIVVSTIMSTTPESLTKEELRDGIGEVVNIVAGNAKAALSPTEYSHEITLPAVVFGRGHEIAHSGNAPCIVVIFEVAGQPMAVLVSMSIKRS